MTEKLSQDRSSDIRFDQLGIRVVVDDWQRTEVGDKKRAYDSEDVIDRYLGLKAQLSTNELERLAREDETEMLVACLAETIKLELFPYKLVEHQGKIGSLTRIVGDDGSSVWVFRDIVSILQNRVNKFPADDRSKAVLEGYVNTVIPALNLMGENQTAVYFSPPASDGGILEGEYGFGYFLTKKRDQQTDLNYFDAVSIKIDWQSQDYFDNLNRLGLDVDRQNYPNDYWAVVNQVKTFRVMSRSQVVKQVMGEDARLLSGPDKWIDSQTELYAEARAFVKEHSDIFVAAVIGGAVHQLREVVAQLQLQWLQSKKPQVYWEIQRQVALYGYAELLLACGLIEFGDEGNSFVSELGMNMRGMELMDRCVQLKCLACDNTDIREHDTECRRCHWAPGRSVEAHRDRLRKLSHEHVDVKIITQQPEIVKAKTRTNRQKTTAKKSTTAKVA